MSETKKISFVANLILRGKIECETGLHIGGSKEKMEIGGVDSPVIRDPKNQLPYIPGSSIKGKLRSLLEFGLGAVDAKGEISADTEIVRLFGYGALEDEAAKKVNIKAKRGPTRLIVRDAYPDTDTQEMWQGLESETLYTEFKGENFINRLTSMANPRFIERVVAGSKFNFELVYGIYAIDEEDTETQYNTDLAHLMQALRMLEHNFLGKSGSRGYGRISFHLAEPVILTAEQYKQSDAAYQKATKPLTDADLTPLREMSDLTYSTTKE
ncbi:MAG: type III-A CRISPR-associated RAMP protein Csm3 [Bacteroidetes bacterium]|nr:MAG: type III-A CRISPR-associated RAMP protein Csm3 [Bacteroidota bacterium]